MLSRIFWVAIAGFALVAGMVVQDGHRMFSWGHHAGISDSTERTVEDGVERTVGRSVDGAEFVGSDGREIQLSPEAKRAFGNAVGGLVKAELALKMLRISDGSEQEIAAASAARDHARADVERLKNQIKSQEQATGTDRAALRDQIRNDVSDTVRDAVRN